MAPPPAAPTLLLWGLPLLQAPGDGVPMPFAPERRFQLLVLLGLQSGQWVERDRVAALLWPGHALGEARRNLRKVVFRARALPGAGALESTDHALRWPVATDLQAFDAALRRGDFDAALAWRRGPPFDGVDDPANTALGQSLASERARLEAAWMTAALEQLHGMPDPAARTRAARRMLAVDPLDEPALRALLQAEQAQGHAAEARAAYQRYAALLAQELGVEPARDLRELASGMAGTVPGVGPGTPPAGPPPAPAAGPGFIGRRTETAQALALLQRDDLRALALLGPGGIGKSRFARELLPACAALFPGGAHWVELQDVATLPAALARLGQVLGAQLLDTHDALAQLLRQLPAPRHLLVLDNVEHLPELMPALQRLLDAAPASVLLLTSRTRPPLAGLQVLALTGLAVPDEDSRDFEVAATFDAVRLFEQRACAVQRHFALQAHLAAVIDIVEAVAGMPLAIELAAGWVRLLPPEQVALDLRGSIDLLERDPAAMQAPARPDHASLRAVLDGTWQMLAPRERQALAVLSVFRGGCTRAAAQAVAGCSLPLLSSLVDKSLVSVDEPGRFALHPVVAAHAAERLAEDPAAQAQGTQRHAAHYAQAWAALAPHARGDPRLLVDGVRAEFANGRAAWAHAARQQRADLVEAMVPTWRSYYENEGRLVEGIGQLRLALDLPADAPRAAQALSRLRQALSTLFYRKGDLQEARAIAEDALALAESCGEHDALKGCLGTLGLCLWHAGDPAAALLHFQRALSLAQHGGDRHGTATSLGHLAIAEKALGRYESALALNRQALAMERELGNQRGVASKLNNIGNLHRALGQFEPARHWFTEGLQHCREYKLAAAAPYLRMNLGLAETELGLLASARAHLQTVLVEMHDAGQLQVELSVELGLARIDILEGDDASARRRLGRVVALAQAKAFHTHPVQAASIYAELLAARGRRLQAAGVLLMAATQPALDEMDRQGVGSLLGGLALVPDELAQAQRETPTLDAVLAQILAAGDTAPG